jgi:hypothetical protein
MLKKSLTMILILSHINLAHPHPQLQIIHFNITFPTATKSYRWSLSLKLANHKFECIFFSYTDCENITQLPHT